MPRYDLLPDTVRSISVPNWCSAITPCGDLDYDTSDPINAGILFDRQAGLAERMMRQVRYQCPKSVEIFDFLTNEMKIPPASSPGSIRCAGTLKSPTMRSKTK